jgi:hypothetical protein
MSGRRFDPDARLEESLLRIQDALAQSRNRSTARLDEIVAAARDELAASVLASVADERRGEKEERERRRRERSRADATDLPRAVVTAIVAVVCVGMALTNPHLWWLVFVALGLGTDAAKVFGRARKARQEEAERRPDAQEQAARPQPSAALTGEPEQSAPPAPPAPTDPRVARIQQLSEQILAELESGPPIVREVVTEPQATIGGLRQACIEIARRERELRVVLDAQEEGALLASREALASRLSGERDEIVRERLGQALRALDDKIAHRAALATAATRLEAENTRILYTLESLHLQLLRARSTDMGAPELGGKLRESLRDLGAQIDAVAEALEVASAPVGAVPAPASGSSPEPTPAADAQAERREAARRAAQAGQAQRR